MNTARDIIQRNPALVSLPETAARLNEMVNDPLSTAADISAAVVQDAELTERLLDIINSPFYDFPARIGSISMAVTILGVRQLRDLVLAATVLRRFGRGTSLPFGIDDFWRHSMCCAVAARAFARRMRVANRERYFVAGLLHDIGMIGLYLTAPEQTHALVQRARQSGDSPVELEQAIAGVAHTELGAEMLRHWRLPDSLIEPVALHHTPQRAGQYARETAAIHMADAIASRLQPELLGEHDQRYDPRAWELLDLGAEALEEVVEEVERRLDDTLQLLYYDTAA
ncbi:MAG TPA: HDOD domain-containing protein [Gammaproteobacteria bacterium]|nr:HDOD domain-containing protein [Gammaproteobacteria bacterium]